MAYIEGKTTYETIYGTAGDDTIDSRGGSDIINDFHNSDDTYIFGYGYGQPTYTDNGGNDTIMFKDGIKASDIKFYITQRGYLMPRIKDTNDKPEIAGWPDPKHKIENWVFQDGTVLTSQDVDDLIDHNTRVLVYTADKDNVKIGQGNNLVYLLQGSDHFVSTGGNNIIEASSGNDNIINQGNGHDEIYLGTGNDYSENWGGDDRYIYDPGDGQDTYLDKAGDDTMKFGRGIVKSNLIFKRKGDDLVITFTNKSTDSVTIKDWCVASNYKIETFELWDGTQISSQDVDKKIGLTPPDPVINVPDPTVTGTDGYDYLVGHYDDDVYYLKKGNDRVMDYAGDDTYLFNKGDGADNITDQNGDDAIIFGDGISKSDLSFKVDPNNSQNLIISINGTSDSINVNKWFKSDSYQIEAIKFLNGSYLSNDDINSIIQQMSSSSSTNSAQVTPSADTSGSTQQNITLVNSSQT